MLDYQADADELAVVCEPYDNTGATPHSEAIRQDEYVSWGNYALFLFEQQGSYCQLG